MTRSQQTISRSSVTLSSFCLFSALASSRCFARDGFHGATVQEICREAKMSPGHLYHYFSSKEEIVGAMAEAAMARAFGEFTRLAEGTDIVTALLDQIDHHHECGAQDDSRLFFDVLAEAGRNPAIGGILHRHGQMGTSLLADFLRKGQGRGQVDPTIDADLAAAVLFSVIDSAKMLQIRDPDIDLGEAVDMLKMLISQFLTPPAGKSVQGPA